MIVTAREFTTAAEVFASAKAAHRACFKPKVRPVTATPILLPAPTVVTRVPAKAAAKPSWMLSPTVFEDHVFAYRTAIRIKEMVAAGLIEEVSLERRTLQQIVRDVLEDFKPFTIADLKSARRNRALCLARMTAIYEVRKQRPDMSFPAIGRWFGGRDHTTILHSVRKIAGLRGEA